MVKDEHPHSIIELSFGVFRNTLKLLAAVSTKVFTVSGSLSDKKAP